VGVVIARLFDEPSPRAEAGGNPLPPCQDINGDGSSDLTDAIYVLNWLFQGGQAPGCPATNGEPAGLPDTGQTTCHDEAGDLIDCASATCAGQDGLHATGCSSEGRFKDNGDGTVTDHCTGLMWQKDTGNDGNTLNWCGALAYCENLSTAGHDDWRLPDVRELQSIVDYGRLGPAIDPVFGVNSSSYWSSTSSAGASDAAWDVTFEDGNLGDSGKDDERYVRAVRSGP
jgi:hypothetical protein